MQKKKNKKMRRKIELIIKMCMFVIGGFALLCRNIDLYTILPTPTDFVSHDSSDTDFEKIIPMHGLSQEGIPTGCESVSTVALLQHWNVDIDVDAFIKDYLPCQNFYRENGVLYGANPHESFAGSPYEKSSLGCYPEVIMKAIYNMQSARYANMDSLEFQNVSGTDLQTLCDSYIGNEIPILLWITIDLKEPVPGMQYHLEDGSLYTWMKHEHCVVLCGYDEKYYYYIDPLENGEIVRYEKELVALRYKQLGKYALVIRSK